MPLRESEQAVAVATVVTRLLTSLAALQRLQAVRLRMAAEAISRLDLAQRRRERGDKRE